jgi:hypothetical protein
MVYGLEGLACSAVTHDEIGRSMELLTPCSSSYDKMSLTKTTQESMKITFSLTAVGLAMLLAGPQAVQAAVVQADSGSDPVVPENLILASNARPAFRNQQRYRYRYSYRSSSRQRYRYRYRRARSQRSC